MKYKFLKATGEIYEEVIRLLEDNSLPTSDLAGKELYALLDEDGKLLGSGGLEILVTRPWYAAFVSLRKCRDMALGESSTKSWKR